MAYKLPGIKDSSRPLVQNGVAFVYMDVNSQQWTLSDRGIDDKNHAVYYTLQQIYKSDNNKADIAWVSYKGHMQ